MIIFNLELIINRVMYYFRSVFVMFDDDNNGLFVCVFLVVCSECAANAGCPDAAALFTIVRHER